VSTTLAYVSGGSNVDAERSVPQAARELKSRYPGARFSRCYRNASIGFDGPDFTNFVVELPVVGGPSALRETLQRIEKHCGRPDAAPRWAPRAMDLDILLFGDQVIDVQGMKVPRPDLTRWAFMLGPLAELAPGLVHPSLHLSVGELWGKFDQQAHALVPVALDLNTA
jgi:2-amino-4-hydroxy-6-hydroxymethyldihydropteridine diphosphokinase